MVGSACPLRLANDMTKMGGALEELSPFITRIKESAYKEQYTSRQPWTGPGFGALKLNARRWPPREADRAHGNQAARRSDAPRSRRRQKAQADQERVLGRNLGPRAKQAGIRKREKKSRHQEARIEQLRETRKTFKAGTGRRRTKLRGNYEIQTNVMQHHSLHRSPSAFNRSSGEQQQIKVSGRPRFTACAEE